MSQTHYEQLINLAAGPDFIEVSDPLTESAFGECSGCLPPDSSSAGTYVVPSSA